MIGIMNGIIRTTTRNSETATTPHRQTRTRQEPRVNRDTTRQEFERNLSHPRGDW